MHLFTIVERVSGRLAGNLDVRPYRGSHRGDMGIWLGEDFQGRGLGTAAIGRAVDYGFTNLGLLKMEAFVFTGNYPSRRAFEKNGFRLEGTVRRAVQKRGQLLDEWLLGLLPEEWLK